MVKTEKQLEKEWGQERFVTAMGVYSTWALDQKHPIPVDQLEELKSESNDAFDLFASRIYQKATA